MISKESFYTFSRRGLILSNLAMWMGAVSVYAQTSESPSGMVPQETVYVSMPVFVTSIMATAVFTWTVSKYDQSRNRKVEMLEEKLEALGEKLRQKPGDERSVGE